MHAIKTGILLAISILVFIFSAYIIFFKAPGERKTELQAGLVSAAEAGFSNKPSQTDSVELWMLVNQVATYESVECAYVGYAGRPSTQYDPTHMMKALASDSQLVNIINNAAPVVKHFAFLALMQRNPGLSKKVFLSHFKNKATIRFLCGCLGDERPANIDFYYSLKASVLTPFEVQYYRNELLKQYSGSYFMQLL